MSNKLRPAILILAIGALAFSLGYVVFPHAGEFPGDIHNASGASLDPAAAAPYFTVHDFDGTEVRSEEFEGKIVVIDFWATWCGPCLVEIPHYNELHHDYVDKGVEMLGITLQSGSTEQVQEWLARPIRVGTEEFEIEYPVVMGNAEIEATWGPIYGFPMTYLVDSNWKIRKKWLGAVPDKAGQLRILIDELLEEQQEQATN